MKVRLYANPDAPIGTVGIPKDGEYFDAEDARRMVGQGLAVRRAAKRKRKSKPAPPAEAEG